MLHQPHLGNDPAFAQAVVASVAENATVSDILAAREALLALGVDSLEKSTPTQAKQYFDQATKLLTRMDPSAATAPPNELTESLGKAFAISLAKAEGQLELQYLWEKIA